MEIVATMNGGIGPGQAELIRIPLGMPPTLALEFPNSVRDSTAADAIFAQRAESFPNHVSSAALSKMPIPAPSQVAAASSDEAAPLLAGLYVVATGLAAWQHLIFDAYAGRSATDAEEKDPRRDRTDRPASPEHQN